MTAFDRQALLQTLLQELSAAMRLRSEPEHIYTAASVAGFGAVAWGIASLQVGCSATPNQLTSKEAIIVAAVGVVLTAGIIIYKICREHKRYAEFQLARAKVAKLLFQLPGAETFVPNCMLEERSGNGYLYSISLVAFSALGAIGFCLARIFF